MNKPENKWKKKAVKRRLENKNLKKRIRDLTKSRDGWKDKAEKLKKKNNILIKESKANLKLLKKVGKEIKRYWYCLPVIIMIVRTKLETSVSFRAIAAKASLTEIYKTDNKLTHTTILNWVHKIGYYELTKKQIKAKDWIILLDHSIQIGKEKIFVVLGIRKSEIPYNRGLKYSDLTPLLIKSGKVWNGEIIKDELLELQKKLGTIIYAIGDYGSDIKNGLKLAEIKHVYDITHKIASIIKKLYEKDERYIKLTKKMHKYKIKYTQTDLGYLVPIKQRKKSRFANIKSIAKYGKSLINFLDNIIVFENKEEFTKDELLKASQIFSWIYDYKDLIDELYEINNVICKVQKIVKTFGLSKDTEKKSNEILAQLKSKKGIELKYKLQEYFKETIRLIKKKTILITSDILESSFGKYKNYLSKNPMAGITNIVLSIAAFTSSLTKEAIKTALEATTIADVIKWTEINIGITSFKKRRMAFSIENKNGGNGF
jgi:hypothetical protein